MCGIRQVVLTLLFGLFASSGFAQVPLPKRFEESASKLLEQTSKTDPLPCRIETVRPFLDFGFRFEAGYLIFCPLQTFQGKKNTLTTVLRVRPEKGAPVLLYDRAKVPELPPNLKDRMNWHHFHEELEHSGVFAVGEGAYYVDAVVVDDESRLYRKTWQVKAHPHGKEQKAPAVLTTGSVAALSIPKWEGASNPNTGLRVTVLLDAAPINPDARKLRAWDLAFLLNTLTSVLRQLPSLSVRLIAFNLDQQREVFRDEQFNRPGMYRLAHALSDLELGTVSYRVLERQNGWTSLLTNLANAERTSDNPSDIVIFLGPTIRLKQKPEPEMLQPGRERAAPRFFYFQFYPYLGAEFPDSISHLTGLLDGIIFRMHNPGELAEAIEKMQRTLKETAQNGRGVRGAPQRNSGFQY